MSTKYNELTSTQLTSIMDAVRHPRDIERFASIITPAQVAENEHNLNMPRYVDTFEPEEEIDIVAVRANIAGLEAEWMTIRKKMDSILGDIAQ